MSNGGPSCVWCDNGGFWDCGPPPHCTGMIDVQAVEEEGGWVHVGRADMQAGEYDVYCQRGQCRVVLKPVKS